MTIPRSTTIRAGAAVVAGAALAATAFAAPAAASVSTPNIIAPTPGATQINLIGINDFHGRILTADQYAATILAAQQPYGEAGTVIFSNGDAVGASLFESSILDDQPTIDILNTVGVESFTQGNHEFDRGAADAKGRIQSATNGPDLAANVVGPDGTKPFDEYALFTVNGVTVAVVGAVTAETPSLVSPDGIAGYQFLDPVAAVNDVAARLTDGNTANGEAQVVVASYHEGGPLSNAPLADNLSNATFAHLVNDTSPKVAAIFNAHTHQTYAYDAPVPGTDRTRPVIQAGSYGANLAQVVLTVDPATGAVTAAASSVVPTLAAGAIPADIAADPRYVQVRSIIAAAKAQADVLGQEIIGTQTGDISRAKIYDATGAVTNQDDRANASSLGDIVATSMVESITATTGRSVDLALMNPGGLRADLIDGDGKITYKEAATVLPFANNLSVATMTGATLKSILEQQWQRTAAGEVPSRPYLQLGMSEGFVYTYDSNRPEGDRITGMYLWGVPVDAAATYNVAAPTFLAAGGDNFHGFKDASSVADTGMIDLDAFVSWIKAETVSNTAGVVPDQQRNGFEVVGFPLDGPVKCGMSATFTVNRFDLASLGYIANTELSAVAHVVDQDGTASDIVVGTAQVTTPNTAELTITIPNDFATDTFVLSLIAQGSGSYVMLPIEVQCDTVVPPTTSAPATTVPAGTGMPTTPATSPAGDDLATTGADANALFGGVAAALAVLALGATLLVLRRRTPRADSE